MGSAEFSCLSPRGLSSQAPVELASAEPTLAERDPLCTSVLPLRIAKDLNLINDQLGCPRAARHEKNDLRNIGFAPSSAAPYCTRATRA